MISLICRSSESIDVFTALSDQIHDMWFSIDALVVNADTTSFQLRLSEKTSASTKTILICEGVDHVDVDDHESVGDYDINYLLLSKDRRKLQVVCNIPIKITVWLGPHWELSLMNL